MALPDAPVEPPPNGDVLPGLSIVEAAAALGISTHAVRRQVRSGRLASTRIARPQGWVVRVLLEDRHVAAPPGATFPPPSATSSGPPPSAMSPGAVQATALARYAAELLAP